MRLQFLGSGSAFTLGMGNYQSNMVLEDDAKRRLLIDCGTDIRWSLHEAGLSYRDIHHVYISHLHADHVGGLEWLAFCTKFDPSCKKPILHISKTMYPCIWDHVLSGGLRSLEDTEARLECYFDVNVIEENSRLIWNGIEANLIANIHCKSNYVPMPTYGLFFFLNGAKVWLTADTRFTPERLMQCYTQADVIFHDCETTAHPTGVHAHYKELETLPQEIKKKMWLYHYNPGVLPDSVQDGFRGFIKKGQVFDLFMGCALGD